MIRNMMIGMIGYLYETGVVINNIVSERMILLYIVNFQRIHIHMMK